VLLFAFFFRRPARGRQDPFGARYGASMAGPLGPARRQGDETSPDEENLPRWLRPTLRQQRQWSDRQAPTTAREPERFDAPLQTGIDRRTIGYRLVRLSDGPDDLRSTEIGRLDLGDEIEVIGDLGGFVQVRTPGGLEGWVPRMAIAR
jgi:hypothetical protein